MAQRFKRLRFNVGGKIFDTCASTVHDSEARSKLSTLSEASEHYDEEAREFFFDRNPFLFSSILEYHRTGQLHFSHCVCPLQVGKEMDYWEIERKDLAECCQRWFQSTDEYDYYSTMLHEWLDKLDQEERASEDMLKTRSKTKFERLRKIRVKIWRFFEFPNSSRLAKIWGIFFLFVVLASVTIQCGNTVKEFRVPLEIPRRNLSEIDNPKMHMFLSTELIPWLWNIDFFCLVIFCFEVVVRFVCCPFKFKFFTSLFNLIDILSTVNIVVLYVVEWYHPNFWGDDTLFYVMYVLSAFGVLRCLRLIKFAKQMNKGMKLLLLAISASLKEIFLLLVLIAIGTLIFSNMIYFAEFYAESDDFPSIPIGFWWSIVTMTTVGYGDKHPNSAWGYVVGALCAISGMLCTGLPIPIIANNFNVLYSYARRRKIAQSRDEQRQKQIGSLNLYSESGIANFTSAVTKENDKKAVNGRRSANNNPQTEE